jgi:hypothetical protein
MSVVTSEDGQGYQISKGGEYNYNPKKICLDHSATRLMDGDAVHLHEDQLEPTFHAPLVQPQPISLIMQVGFNRRNAASLPIVFCRWP